MLLIISRNQGNQIKDASICCKHGTPRTVHQGHAIVVSADLRRQWLEKGRLREKARVERQEAAFIRQAKFVERARQARELRQGIQLAKYTKQQQRILAQKVNSSSPILC